MDKSTDLLKAPNKIQEGFAGQQTCILPNAKRKFCSTHILCKKLHLTDIGFYPNASFHNRERKEGCQQFILIYCVKGEGWYKIKNKKFQVHANQYFILPKGIPHEYGANPLNSWSIYWVHFTGESANSIATIIQPGISKGPLSISPSALRIMLFEDMMNHLEFLNDNGNLVYANSSLYAFLISFQRLHFKSQEKGSNTIEQIIVYMKDNLNKNLTMEDISKHVHISASRIAALFKQKTKHTPIGLFTSLKIQKASQLLLEENCSIKTAAASVGYDDPYHFSRVFKNIMGTSPKYFKQQS